MTEMKVLFFPLFFLSCAVMAEGPNTNRKNILTHTLGLQLGTKSHDIKPASPQWASVYILPVLKPRTPNCRWAAGSCRGPV